MSRIRVSCLLTPPGGLSPEAYAREIAVEQTVEVPEACITPELERAVVGRVEVMEVEEGGAESARAEISYPWELVSGDVPQLFNLVYGNVSLKPGVRVVGLELPDELLRLLPGPSHGIRGLRKLTGVGQGPLVCVPAKPVGLSVGELARRAGVLAGAGVDLVKDDHGMVDQPWAPFRDRIRRLQEAVGEANARTGGSTVYLPNVTAPPHLLEERLGLALEAGCRGVLLSPIPAGPGALATVVGTGLAVVSHLTMTGVFFQPGAGVAPEVLYGTLLRAAGSDAVIHPNPGGRLSISREECLRVQGTLRGPMGPMLPALPMAGGGIGLRTVPEWMEIYGPDTGFLVGGSLLSRPDLGAAARELVDAVREAR